MNQEYSGISFLVRNFYLSNKETSLLRTFLVTMYLLQFHFHFNCCIAAYIICYYTSTHHTVAFGVQFTVVWYVMAMFLSPHVAYSLVPFPYFLHPCLLATSSVPLSPSPSLLYMLSLLLCLSLPLSLSDFFLHVISPLLPISLPLPLSSAFSFSLFPFVFE